MNQEGFVGVCVGVLLVAATGRAEVATQDQQILAAASQPCIQCVVLTKSPVSLPTLGTAYIAAKVFHPDSSVVENVAIDGDGAPVNEVELLQEERAAARATHGALTDAAFDAISQLAPQAPVAVDVWLAASLPPTPDKWAAIANPSVRDAFAVSMAGALDAPRASLAMHLSSLGLSRVMSDPQSPWVRVSGAAASILQLAKAPEVLSMTPVSSQPPIAYDGFFMEATEQWGAADMGWLGTGRNVCIDDLTDPSTAYNTYGASIPPNGIYLPGCAPVDGDHPMACAGIISGTNYGGEAPGAATYFAIQCAAACGCQTTYPQTELVWATGVIGCTTISNSTGSGQGHQQSITQDVYAMYGDWFVKQYPYPLFAGAAGNFGADGPTDDYVDNL